MEIIEKIISCGVPVSLLRPPYIDVRSLESHFKYLDKADKPFDARPCFMEGSVVDSRGAGSFIVEEVSGGYKYTVDMIFDYDKRFKNHPFFRVSFYCDSSGDVDKHQPVDYCVVTYNKDGSVNIEDRSLLKRRFEAGFFTEDTVLGSVASAAGWICGTMTFLNCRNIKLVDKPQYSSIARHYEKKYKLPRVIYKTLEVSPISKRYTNKDGTKREVESSVPLHLCRGHIKNYTDRPLFGKITGQFFWHPHMRGNKDVGKVIKDYKLVGD